MKIARRNVVLAALVVVLAVLDLALDEGGPPGREVGQLLPDLAPDRASRIVIEDPDAGAGTPGRVELVRTEGEDAGWVLPDHFDYPGYARQVEGLLGRLASITTLDLLSEDAGSHADYGVGAGGVTLRVLDADGALLAGLVQGDVTADGAASYVRRSGDDAVYRAPRFPRITTTATQWIEPYWLAFEPSLVRSVRVSGTAVGGERKIEREAGAVDRWRDAAGTDVSSLVARELLTRARGLFFANVVAGERDPELFAEPAIEIEIELMDGAVLGGVMVGAGERVLASRTGERWVVEFDVAPYELLLTGAKKLVE